jgi:dGTPase
MKREMNWSTLLNSERYNPTQEKELNNKTKTDKRNPFEKDTDRITFSSSLRRLGGKTQVHPLPNNDHVHTRLTHSLEVAKVGRSLGEHLGIEIKQKLPQKVSPHIIGTIVQTACLAHDIGNPPFGHAGERAISEWFKDRGRVLIDNISFEQKNDIANFEGNAQGFRILTQLENHIFSGGLRLTFAVLGTFLKYPWLSTQKQNDKFGAFISEAKVIQEVAFRTGMIPKEENKWSRHPLAYLVEAADDICYSTIDLEDAVELRIIKYSEIEKLLLSCLNKSDKKILKSQLSNNENQHRTNFARLRGPVFQTLINDSIASFKQNYDLIMTGDFEGELLNSLQSNDEVRDIVKQCKKLAKEKIYQAPIKMSIELGCYSTLSGILDAYCGALVACASCLSPDNKNLHLSRKEELILQTMGEHRPTEKNAPPGETWTIHLCLRRALDFVSGMTDRYALSAFNQLQGISYFGESIANQ